jgi:hypothetical protein
MPANKFPDCIAPKRASLLPAHLGFHLSSEQDLLSDGFVRTADKFARIIVAARHIRRAYGGIAKTLALTGQRREGGSLHVG